MKKNLDNYYDGISIDEKFVSMFSKIETIHIYEEGKV